MGPLSRLDGRHSRTLQRVVVEETAATVMRDDAIDDVGLVLVHGEVEYTSSRHGRYEHLLNSCVGEYHAGMILASDLAYIAGLFDADGCFSIGRKRVNGQAKWLRRAILTNGDLGLCQWVQTTLGYGVCYES